MKAKEFARLARKVKIFGPPPRLDRVDLALELDRKSYKSKKRDFQKQLLALQLEMKVQHIPAMIIIEGWDAAGKGGAIHRLVNKFDPRSYVVHPVSAPSQEELDHHYLWRFWKAVPARGRVAVFDRSWYGRVLVERVEGYASAIALKRAYGEINEFERLLTEDGYVIVKIFMHISKTEQKQRFDRRRTNPLKAWKMTDEDYRNRRKWEQYEDAIEEMFRRTHTRSAPWHVVAANDKRWARVAVQEICAGSFARALLGARP